MRIGRPATASMTGKDDHHDHRRAEVGLEQHEGDRDGGHDQQAEDVAPGQPSSSRHGVQYEATARRGQDGELGRLEPERADLRRALGAAPTDEHADEGQHDQPIQERGQRFQTPIVEHRDDHHGDDAEDDEEALLLQEGLGVLPGRERAPRVAVYTMTTPIGETISVATTRMKSNGGTLRRADACSGDCGHTADPGQNTGRDHAPLAAARALVSQGTTASSN